MTDESWLDRAAGTYQRDPDFIAEGLSLELMEQATVLMDAAGITRAELAQRMGVSKPYVTRLFRAPANLTLRSLAQIALALDAALTVSFCEAPTPRRFATGVQYTSPTSR